MRHPLTYSQRMYSRNPRYVVYSSCQVELLEVACVKDLDPTRYASHATWHSVARHVIRVPPVCALVSRAQGSSGVAAAMPLVWRGRRTRALSTSQAGTNRGLDARLE